MIGLIVLLAFLMVLLWVVTGILHLISRRVRASEKRMRMRLRTSKSLIRKQSKYIMPVRPRSPSLKVLSARQNIVGKRPPKWQRFGNSLRVTIPPRRITRSAIHSPPAAAPTNMQRKLSTSLRNAIVERQKSRKKIKSQTKLRIFHYGPRGDSLTPPIKNIVDGDEETGFFSLHATVGAWIIETVAQQPPRLVTATTSTLTIGWDSRVVAAISSVCEFDVQWRICPYVEGGTLDDLNAVEAWADPSNRSDRRVYFECESDFSSVPSAAIDTESKHVTIQGLPGAVFHSNSESEDEATQVGDRTVW